MIERHVSGLFAVVGGLVGWRKDRPVAGTGHRIEKGRDGIVVFEVVTESWSLNLDEPGYVYALGSMKIEVVAVVIVIVVLFVLLMRLRLV